MDCFDLESGRQAKSKGKGLQKGFGKPGFGGRNMRCWIVCVGYVGYVCVHLKDSVLQIHGGASGMGDMPGLGYLAKFDSAVALLLFPFLSINNRLLDCFFEVLFQWK